MKISVFDFEGISLFYNGSLVKRSRRRPLTAETGVRFPYELLVLLEQPNPRSPEIGLFLHLEKEIDNRNIISRIKEDN